VTYKIATEKATAKRGSVRKKKSPCIWHGWEKRKGGIRRQIMSPASGGFFCWKNPTLCLEFVAGRVPRKGRGKKKKRARWKRVRCGVRGDSINKEISSVARQSHGLVCTKRPGQRGKGEERRRSGERTTSSEGTDAVKKAFIPSKSKALEAPVGGMSIGEKIKVRERNELAL